MPPEKALEVGDRVVVPVGVEAREGTVVAIYRTGGTDRIVVELSTSESEESEPSTIVLPIATVKRVTEDSDVPQAGSWLPEFRYERDVEAAIARVLEDQEVDIRREPAMGDVRADLVVIRPNKPDLIVEAKSGKSVPIESAVMQLRRYLENFPGAHGVLVTSQPVPADLRRRVEDNERLSRISIVQWRESKDDRRLASAVGATLSE